MKLPAHEATTAQLGAAFPFVASRPLLDQAALVGRDLHGGLFVHDPFALYRAGIVTNPNIVVLGQIGRGKSALVKTYLFRQAALGRRVVVLDPKGEYRPLAEALGAVPVQLRPGGRVRLNPLEAARTGDLGRQLALIASLASTALARGLEPVEHAALELALASARRRSATPTLPLVVDALLSPDTKAVRSLGLDVAPFAQETRSLALGMRRLVSGELAGMFDGPSTPGLRLDGAVVVLDLSALFRSTALPALVACAVAALEPAWQKASARGRQSFLVVDEAWAVLSDVGVALFLQSSWKLARANGVSNLAVVHRVSDLMAAGASGSVASQVATGLLADSETVVCYGQAAAELDDAARALGLNDRQRALLSRLPRGVALWRVGGRAFLVEHRIGPLERQLVDTDRALRSGS